MEIGEQTGIAHISALRNEISCKYLRVTISFVIICDPIVVRQFKHCVLIFRAVAQHGSSTLVNKQNQLLGRVAKCKYC